MKYKVVYVQNFSLPEEKRKLIAETETKEEQEAIFLYFRSKLFREYREKATELFRLGLEAEGEKHLYDFNQVKLFMLNPDQDINDLPIED